MRLFQNPIHIIILFGTLILLINLNNPCFALESNSYEVILKKGWNLIALPLTPTDNYVFSLFPEAEAAYRYQQGGYIPVSYLEPGIGYWIKVPADKHYTINGESFGPPSIPEHEWNETSLKFKKPDGTWGTSVNLKGEAGMSGKNGSPPEHEWNSTSLRFKNPNGTWGEFVNLQGSDSNTPMKKINANTYYTDCNIGIGTNNPKVSLDVNGGIRIGHFSTSERPSCYSETEGTLIYDNEKKKPYICNGSDWKPLDSDYDSDGITDWNDQNDNDPTLKHIQLIPENIKSGATVFGVTGTYTEDADCGKNNLLKGSSCYSKGSKIVGTIPTIMSGQEVTSIYASESLIKARVPMGFYSNNTEIYIRDSDLKPSNIKKGTSILGVMGTYSELSFAQNMPFLIDLSGFRQLVMCYNKSGSYGFHYNPIVYQHSTENFHYYLCSIQWFNSYHYTCYGLLLIGKYDKLSNQIYLYEKELSSISVGEYENVGPSEIKIVDNLIYFLQCKSYRRNDIERYSYVWMSFNGNSFVSGSGDALPFNESTEPNNIPLTFNGKTWKPYLEYNTEKHSRTYSLTCRLLLKNR